MLSAITSQCKTKFCPNIKSFKNFKINGYKIKYNYCRVLGSFVYLDYSYSIYDNDKNYITTLYIWIDNNEKIIEVKSGCMHNEPLPKDIVELIIKYLDLEKYTIK